MPTNIADSSNFRYQAAMPNCRFTLIAGPTASGKSALAMRQARASGGLIVNADSMQVYDTLRVLTARPDANDMAAVPHALYGHVPATHAYSVGAWCADVVQLLETQAQIAPEQPIIFVGGTGLYFRALLEGLSPIPAIPDTIRSKWRAFAEASDMAEVRAALIARDPATADRLMATDRQRHVRALEVIEATGTSILEWQQQPGRPLVPAEATERLVIDVPRETLYARAAERVEQMFNGGAIEEVRALAALEVGPDGPITGALGVSPIKAMLAGLIDRDAAMSQTILETRHYIKRQLTWQRRNMNAWKLISTQQ